MQISKEQYNKLPKRLQEYFGQGNIHATVKPLSLCRYLCRLITPPDGIVLDPFAGSGSTCIACKMEGFNYIGIEKEAEYVEIAKHRLESINFKQETLI